jgi:hypothetical protein
MIIHRDMEMLAVRPFPEGCSGYDCDGHIIIEGQMVEVVIDDPYRQGQEKYEFCSKGHYGKASRHVLFPVAQLVMLHFENHDDPISCIECSLRVM